MENEKNKVQALEQNKEEKKKGTLITVLLTAAVVVSLSLLGYYVWAKGVSQQPDKNPIGSATPTPAEYASLPTNTPEPTPTVAPTSIPTMAATLIPTATPTPKPVTTLMPKPEFEPVKALYLKPGSVQGNIDHYIDLANRTEINAYVIDIKSDDGTILYKSEIEDVIAANACMKNFDICKVIQKLHDNNIRVIGRMVTFKDSKITKYKPELAIQSNGKIFKQSESGDKYSYWLDATNQKAWDYIASIVNEAIHFGFDEIQFDYIRFPETSLYDYELGFLEDGRERHEYIEEFIAFIRSHVPETILSADIFGMPLISSRDYGEIGQTLETIGINLDYISPMIYPSHYANNAPKGAMSNKVGQVINGVKFTHPDLSPYDVVYNTLIMGKKRIEAAKGYNIKVRPYIQGFTASYLPSGYWMKYGVEEHRAQIQAIYDAGYEEWIFWNSPNEYVEEAFLPKE